MTVCLTSVTFWVLRDLPLAQDVVEITIEPGTTVRGIAQVCVDNGVTVDPAWLYWFFRLSGQSRLLRAGSYELKNGDSAWDLLQKISRGQESLQALVLVEGWTFRQFRQALDRATHLQHLTRGQSEEAIMAQLGRYGQAAEGRFFPDTYTYGKGDSDLRLMTRALFAMDRQLAAAWQKRDMSIDLDNAEQALVLASIVEKETGKPSDRPMISSVFHNRLRVDMPLQTDPTVIYGLGDTFDGNLRRRDLQTDHPWNTYTRKGLPPTPIAMPGKAALLAAVQPARSNAYYFVARGDGSSEFSPDLETHNAAVDRFQRRRNAASISP
ncbi:MAG: endolytic transglycosylase MltG [Betaproteobacteria bacterium]|nr:endolytic transglycosylase MltG [Betaproteobacteria bacterium]NBY04425.1 endolytic transglycosylase MltG [Betaproteobacteria bacterium]